MAWWIWLVAGIVILLGELLTPGGFYLIFFGAGAVVTALAAAVGLEGPGRQGVCFLLLSLAALLLFRQPLLRRLRRGHPLLPDELTGEVAVAREEIGETRGWIDDILGPGGVSGCRN
jgi:membrane protein implicated in regulation of membrane protease activity